MNRYAEYLIRRWEGCELIAYKDSVNIWTVGYGHIVGVAEGLQICQGQADNWLFAELEKYETFVKSVLIVNLTDWQIGALTSFTYNLGVDAFENSTLLKKVNENPENYDDIAIEFIKWDNAGGKEIKGLSKRRINEADMYANGQDLTIK